MSHPALRHRLDAVCSNEKKLRSRSHDIWSRQRMQSGGFFRGYTKLCKGLALILLLVHLVVQLFPSAVTYLALIPGR